MRTIVGAGLVVAMVLAGCGGPFAKAPTQEASAGQSWNPLRPHRQEAAGMNWLETVWPGNDAVKVTFLEKLRETRAKSAFADELRVLATDVR